ncbi:unnamed protein product [Moneuplotes crassus]|uniref:Uncharacterized protein n=1 Tax=Euplotes crassus TaxID=5936 RepID=A0AAD2D108_EUPCR|nr:unnamed protein product [Moneuplotes crassus]
MSQTKYKFLKGKKINFEVLKQYLKRNSQKSQSTEGRKAQTDKYIKLAEEIRHRSESRKKMDYTSSFYQSISKFKKIYPRNKLDYIRMNFLTEAKMHETSHYKMYGTLNKSVDSSDTNRLFNNFISGSSTINVNQAQGIPSVISEQQREGLDRKRKIDIKKLNLSTCNSRYRASSSFPMKPLKVKIKSITSNYLHNSRHRKFERFGSLKSKSGERKYRFFRLKTIEGKTPSRVSKNL